MSPGPLFFRRSPQEDLDFIPAIDWDTRQRLDPNRRESQLGRADRSSECQATRPRWSFNTTQGELHSRYMQEVTESEINEMLMQAWNRYGKEAVRRIVLHLAPDAIEDSHRLLQRCGFVRTTAREGEVPELVFIGPAKKLEWRRDGRTT